MPHARTTDPETSHEAAASVDNVTITQKRILDILERLGAATDETIYVEYLRLHRDRISESGLRTRRAELVALGKVVHKGYGVSNARRRSRRWSLAD